MSTLTILDRIKKCLALSSSSQPAEAAAALAMAEKLMAKNGLSTADVELNDIGEEAIRSHASIRNMKPYELRLVRLIANEFGARVFFRRGWSYARTVAERQGHYIMIGAKSKMAIAAYTAAVLLRRLTAARKAFLATIHPWRSRAEKVRAADGFCVGWVAAVQRKVADFARLREQHQSDTGGATSLPVPATQQKTQEQAAIERYCGLHHPNTKTGHAQERDISQSDIIAGYQAGQHEQLHVPVGSEVPGKLPEGANHEGAPASDRGLMTEGREK